MRDIIDVSLRAYVIYSGGSIPKVYENLRETLIRKNADYGNASVKNGGNVGNYVRMSDKLSRLQNLLGKEGKTNYESVNKTWLSARHIYENSGFKISFTIKDAFENSFGKTDSGIVMVK